MCNEETKKEGSRLEGAVRRLTKAFVDLNSLIQQILAQRFGTQNKVLDMIDKEANKESIGLEGHVRKLAIAVESLTVDMEILSQSIFNEQGQNKKKD